MTNIEYAKSLREVADFYESLPDGAIELVMSIERKQICRLVSAAVYECPDSLLEEAAEYAER